MWAWFDWMVKFWKKMKRVGLRVWGMGHSDPREVVFAVKMGIALFIISLLSFLKQPFQDVEKYSLWAILTVVLIFEFNIGATLSRSLNRGIGTLSAGGLALALAMLPKLAGEWEKIVMMVSIFIVATDRFLLIAIGATVSIVVNVCIYPIWAGEDLHNLVAQNFMGVATSLEGVVNNYLNCIEYERVASKILTYQASDDVVYSGYRSAVESTSTEDALMSFAIWEPPHGRYKMFRYPWKNYVKVSGALRHCAFMVMAMHGCILSEIQAPADKRQVFCKELKKVGSEAARVLRELGNKVKKMEKLGEEDILFEVHEAAEELQQKIDKFFYFHENAELCGTGNMPRNENGSRGLLQMDEERHFLQCKSLSEAALDLGSVSFPKSCEENLVAPDNILKPAIVDTDENMLRKQTSMPAHFSFQTDLKTKVEVSKTYENASSLTLATFTSLLIEFVARLHNLVDSFEELGEKAKFKDPLEQQQEPVTSGWIRLFNCYKSKD
ncbi:aluminum-activated malate transporter [Trifolium repens]|nr:aluminum-activated malate transporter [Trifolium repens]